MSTKLKNYRTDMMKKYAKMSKASLARKIMKALKKLPKAKLVQLCYELEKRKLPSIERGFQSQVARIPRRVSVRPIPRKLRTTDYMTERRMTQKANRRRSAKQRANDKRLGRMAKARAKAKRRLR
tara:strand:- start:490 stop:864 length:375 start_codon:yes stop_codon:yes gene_type:complete